MSTTAEEPTSQEQRPQWVSSGALLHLHVRHTHGPAPLSLRSGEGGRLSAAEYKTRHFWTWHAKRNPTQGSHVVSGIQQKVPHADSSSTTAPNLFHAFRRNLFFAGRECILSRAVLFCSTKAWVVVCTYKKVLSMAISIQVIAVPLTPSATPRRLV